MTKKWIALLASTAAGLLFSAAALAASGGNLQQAGNDLSDNASLQRGAQLYMNYCAGCHSSRDVEMLAGAPDYAQKQLAERKHVSLILSGQEGYASLSEEDRRTLAEQIRALDAASTVVLAAPTRVHTGQAFEVRVEVTGGAGPAVGSTRGASSTSVAAAAPGSTISAGRGSGMTSGAATSGWPRSA